MNMFQVSEQEMLEVEGGFYAGIGEWVQIAVAVSNFSTSQPAPQSGGGGGEPLRLTAY